MNQDQGERSKGKRRRYRLRVILALLYLGLAITGSIYETNAHKLLSRAHDFEEKEKYQTAALAYMMVVEKFPLSFAVVEARTGLQRIEPAVQDSPLPDRLQRTMLEDALGERFNPYLMDWVPFLAWFVCGTLLIVVFFSRLRRRGLAFLALLGLAAASFGSAIQLVWYGFIEQKGLSEIADKVMSHRIALYVASYILLAFTVLLTLSSTRAGTQTEHVADDKSVGIRTRH